MPEEMLEEELDDEQEEMDEEEVEETESVAEVPLKVELLEYRSKEEIVQEIESYVIDENLSLEEKINKCRFQEELKPLIKDINFEENILVATFEGDDKTASMWNNIQKLVEEKNKTLPTKKEYIKNKISEDKNKVDAENRKRKEAAKPKPKAKPKAESKTETKKYKYPFKIHFAGHNVETDHIFEKDKEYKPEEITKKMLEHQYYEFAGSVSYTYIEKDNVLIPIFQQYKKG